MVAHSGGLSRGDACNVCALMMMLLTHANVPPNPVYIPFINIGGIGDVQVTHNSMNTSTPPHLHRCGFCALCFVRTWIVSFLCRLMVWKREPSITFPLYFQPPRWAQRRRFCFSGCCYLALHSRPWTCICGFRQAEVADYSLPKCWKLMR